MTRTKKRNNYTLSAEAQKIVDKIDPYKKSGFVSEAIEQKSYHETANKKIKLQAILSDNELLFTCIEAGNFNISLQPGDKIIRP